jgi:Ca2+-binding RTX toxin-like protein
MAQVIGTENSEVLQGSEDSDLILGLAGDDDMEGKGGSDLLDGGPGRDGLFGDEGDDVLLGGAAPQGDPTLDDDLLDGGPGSDWAVYSSQSGTFDLARGRAETLFPGYDLLVGIENIAASGTLIGDDADNILLGLGRQPDLFVGGGGNDLMIGSDAVHPGGFPNFDTVDYAADPAGIAVDLSTGEAVDGFCGHDRIAGIEAVTGSQFEDSILGNSAPNLLSGGDGDDRIEGRGDADILGGGLGVDLLDGGDGSDWIHSTAAGTIDLGAGTATDAATGEVDTLIGIENVLSEGAGDILIGDAGANRFAMLESNSTVTGGEGADRYLQLQPGSGFSIETVTDFERGADLVQFQTDALGFEQPLPEGPLDPGLFALGTAADEDDFFIFDPGTGTLSIDRDGSGEGEAVPSLILEGETELAASDIEIVPADFLGSLVLGGDEILV